MTIDDLRNFYGLKTDLALSKKLKISKGTVSKWRSNGIPEEKQAVFQVRSNGKLKADLKQETT